MDNTPKPPRKRYPPKKAGFNPDFGKKPDKQNSPKQGEYKAKKYGSDFKYKDSRTDGGKPYGNNHGYGSRNDSRTDGGKPYGNNHVYGSRNDSRADGGKPYNKSSTGGKFNRDYNRSDGSKPPRKYDKAPAGKYSAGPKKDYGNSFKPKKPFTPPKDDVKLIRNNYTPHFNEDNDFAEIELDSESAANKAGAAPPNGAVIGRNAVRELLKSNRAIDKIFVKKGDREGSAVVIVAEAISRGIPVIEADKNKLDVISGFAHHQGVVAMAAEKEYCDVEDIIEIAKQRGEVPLIVIADEIADPYNLGALIRCAEAAGAHGLIIPKRRAVGLTPVVSKASAGAIEHLAVAKVANIANTIEVLKKMGVWTFAAEVGGTPYHECDFKVPSAVVFGSEGESISRIIKEKCDFTVSIPMRGKVNSLNVSTAASVILCEAARQRELAGKINR